MSDKAAGRKLPRRPGSSPPPLTTLGAFATLYLSLLTPFGFAGHMLITAFSTDAARIQRLYFWDLLGAALGSATSERLGLTPRRRWHWPSSP